MSSDSESNNFTNLSSSSDEGIVISSANTIFEGKIAQFCALVKSTIFIVGTSNFGIVYFKRYIFILRGKNFRFISTLKYIFRKLIFLYNI